MSKQPIQQLYSARCGQRFTIVKIEPLALKALLGEMGIQAGKNVQVLHRAPWNGPMAIQCEGITISLRKEDTIGVEVIQYNPG
ncbi:MAG: ferrous iron transport protein A [Sphingobacteriia bacterium]|nr:ferrous iron transport protein A [Sphingobacteriia bacterium]